MTKQRMEIVKAVAFRAFSDKEDRADMISGTPMDVWVTSRNGNFKRIENVVLTKEERQVALEHIKTIKADMLELEV